MRERVTKTIDGIDFTHTQLGAKEGRKVLVMITKSVGPGLGKLLGETNAVSVTAAIGDAVKDLADSLTVSDLEMLCETMGRSTEMLWDGKFIQLTTDHQDIVFAGKYGTMFKWLWFCLEVNYSSFFDMLGIAKATLSEGVQKVQG